MRCGFYLTGTLLWLKASFKVIVSVLQKKSNSYRPMNAIQRKTISISPGNMNMQRSFILWYWRVHLAFEALVFWGEKEAWCCELNPTRLKQETVLTITQVKRLGIDQHELRSSNVLWNPDLKRVMMIDFELSKHFQRGNLERKEWP
jgi:hypothetical protein